MIKYYVIKHLKYEDPKYDGYQHGLASLVYKFFDKKIPGSEIKIENISNKESAEELQKPIIRKFNKRKVHSPFMDNIWVQIYQICN